MKKGMLTFLFILIIFSMVSCNGVNPNTSSSSGMTESQQTKEDLISKNIDLLSQIEVLKGSLKKFESEKNDASSSDDSEKMLLQSMMKIEEKYPEIDLLQNSFGETARSNEISKIIIYKTIDPSKKITLTDTSIIKNYDPIMVQYMFTSERVLGKYDSYVYEIYYGDTKVSITLFDSNIFSITQYPGKYFVTDSKINQLGISFLDPPQNYPENTLLGKMLSSGIMYNEVSKVPYLLEFNISSLVYSFNGAEKTLVVKPNLKDAKVIGKLTFYYFGQKIYMTVYNDYVLIVDGNTEKCYKMKNEAINEMLATMSVP